MMHLHGQEKTSSIHAQQKEEEQKKRRKKRNIHTSRAKRER
jgi:hypothetical protein